MDSLRLIVTSLLLGGAGLVSFRAPRCATPAWVAALGCDAAVVASGRRTSICTRKGASPFSFRALRRPYSSEVGMKLSAVKQEDERKMGQQTDKRPKTLWARSAIGPAWAASHLITKNLFFWVIENLTLTLLAISPHWNVAWLCFDIYKIHFPISQSLPPPWISFFEPQLGSRDPKTNVPGQCRMIGIENECLIDRPVLDGVQSHHYVVDECACPQTSFPAAGTFSLWATSTTWMKTWSVGKLELCLSSTYKNVGGISFLHPL
jgi:hypothetical protein